MNKCRLCAENEVELLIDFGDQPIVHHLLNIKDDPYDVYPFQLGYCNHCSFLQLLQPLSPLILYENYFTLSSWKNQPHVDRLIDVLKSMIGMSKDTCLLEIGCNDGSFIEQLYKNGINNCTGIEPTKDAYQIAKSKGIDVYNEFFSRTNNDLSFDEKHYDVVISRQVLEHITNLEDFMLSVDHFLKDDGFLVIEVPDSSCQLDYLDYALWEEHVNYFTYNTLVNLLRKYGFEIIHYETTLFSGKTITVFAEKRKKESKDIYNIDDLIKIELYRKKYPIFKKHVKEILLAINQLVIYGCGSRSSTFVNFFELDNVLCFIDDQIEKQNCFLPGSKLEIVPWDESWSNAFFLLGVNTESEIKVINKRNLKRGQFSSILPPSRYLPSFWRDLIDA